MKKINVAVVGASGLVGRKILEILAERDFPINQLFLFSSARSAGKKLNYRGQEVVICELDENSFDESIDVALFSAGAATSLKFAPLAAKKGIYVVDNSSAWRENQTIPLVVPEVNANDLIKDQFIIANPNCSTTQAVLPLNVVNNLFKLARVDYTTYQAVSGSGLKGIEDLEKTSRGEEPTNYPYPISNNVLPHIDSFLSNDYTKEEIKMRNETRKILHCPEVQVSATCVRVPVLNSHSVAITAHCHQEVDVDLLKEQLKSSAGITLKDDVANNVYPLPLHASNNDEVFVGRIRKDLDNPKIVHLFCVSDNLRKGAATNTIQIAEELLKRGIL